MKLENIFLMILVLFIIVAPMTTFSDDEAPATSNNIPAEKVEPDHARAVIQYNAGNHARAVEILSVLLNRYPKYIPALELKAISLRQLNQNERALDVYKELLALGQTDEEKTPYYFEMGSVYFNKKDYIEAKKYFNLALKGKFNWGATHYFLGLIAYQQERFEEAEFHFNASTWSSAEAIKPMAHFYLGLVFAKENHTPGLLWAFTYTLDHTKEDLKSEDSKLKDTAEGVQKASTEILKNFDKNNFLASLFISTQYDSNIAVLPDVITTQQTSGKATVKQVASANIGFMSSPVRNWQISTFYKNYYNYNFSSMVKGYSFFSNIPSLTATIWPNRRFSWGAMLDATYTFNDRYENGQTIFRPFSLVGNLGPYAKFEYIPRLIMTARYSYKPKKYYLDSSDDTLKRTGTGHSAKITATWNSLKFYANPTIYGSWERDNTDGQEFRATIWGAGVSNQIIISKKDSLSTSFDFLIYNFPDRLSYGREDTNYSIRGMYNHIFNKYLSGVADVTFVRNSSNVPATYQYSRFMASIGANISI